VAVDVFPATAIPNRLLDLHGFFWSLKYFPSINSPTSCLSMESATHVVPCTVERLVGASPFFLLLQTSLFETLLIHPCTML